MIKIKDFELVGFNITWKLLDIGFRGSVLFAGKLSSTDIIDYSISMLTESDDADVIALACEYEKNTSEIEKLLGVLAHKENSEYDLEFKKWKVLYVLKHLPDNGLDYLQGLIDLGDIWVDLDFPHDSPHIFQGKGNDITPEEYYTLANFKFLFQKHLDWLNEEIRQINSCSKLCNSLCCFRFLT